MNIFVLDNDPIIAAQTQCDKHVVKMIVESAQMLSTAHRMCDGHKSKRPSKSGKRMVWYYDLYEGVDDLEAELLYYKAVHHYHPCTVWTMESDTNYRWHYEHFIALCDEYTYRYGKIHGTDSKLRNALWTMPRNIPIGPLTEFKLAMASNPECFFYNDPVKSYRTFYQTKQDRFKMEWTKRPAPSWFIQREECNG
jgi:hypothetical protein